MIVPAELEDAVRTAARDVVGEAALATPALTRAIVDRSKRYTSERERLSSKGPGDLAARAAFFTVADAVIRQVAHYAYHVGQIVYLAKLQRGEAWVSLSIPRGASGAFNREMAQRFSSPGSGSK